MAKENDIRIYCIKSIQLESTEYTATFVHYNVPFLLCFHFLSSAITFLLRITKFYNTKNIDNIKDKMEIYHLQFYYTQLGLFLFVQSLVRGHFSFNGAIKMVMTTCAM